MLFLKEEYNRTSLDKTENITVRVTEEGEDDDDIESGILRDIFRSTASYGATANEGGSRRVRAAFS